MARQRPIIKDKTTGKRKEKLLAIQSIPVSDNDIYIQSRPQITLGMLAYEYYNDATLWWVIARANNLKSAIVGGGITLRIPVNPQVTYIRE